MQLESHHVGYRVSIHHPLQGLDYWEVHLHREDNSVVDVWAFNNVSEAFRHYHDTLDSVR